MKVGIAIFPTDKAIQPVQLAKEVEDRGFESLWFPEHSHIPTSRITPWGGREGAPPLPEEYWRTHDQFVGLAAAAAVTENLMLGPGITLVAQRDPLWLAKECASLDLISNGLDDVFGYHLTLFFSPRPQNCVFLVFIGQKECRLYAIKTDE